MRRRIGETLIAHGVITEQGLQMARFEQKRSGGRIGDILVRLKLATEIQVTKALCEQNGLPFKDLTAATFDPEAVKLIPRQFALKHRCIGSRVIGGELSMVMADPLSLAVINDLESATGRKISLSLATPSQILAAIEKSYPETSLTIRDGSKTGKYGADATRALNQMASPERKAAEQQSYIEVSFHSKEENPESAGPITALTDRILEEAVSSNASDIHIEAGERGVVVRHRLDGILRETATLPKLMHDGLVTRLKVLASMDIAEKRLPQDGRVRIRSKEGRKIDFRVSSLKTLHGEKIVLRILDHSKGIPPLEDLGFSPGNLKVLQQFLRRRHGMILTVGPTGSGKSTTLASAVASIRSTDINIVTIEDPIEYELSGVNQTQVHDKIKLTFASSLRSILRQDPDVILVGEIRDQETARIALQAAQTGHLVLSTLHTDDAPSAVTRLQDMGIEPYVIGSALIGVIAQRLVRRLCPQCRTAYSPSAEVMEALNLSETNASWPVYRAAGCPECRQMGYRGRTGIYEIMEINGKIARMISQQADENAIRDTALEGGMTTLGEDGLAKVKAGITSPDELLRVVTEVKEVRTVCPDCGHPAGVDFLVCPECGRRMGGGCPECGRALKPNWNFCPFCTSKVSHLQPVVAQTG